MDSDLTEIGFHAGPKDSSFDLRFERLLCSSLGRSLDCRYLAGSKTEDSVDQERTCFGSIKDHVYQGQVWADPLWYFELFEVVLAGQGKARQGERSRT